MYCFYVPFSKAILSSKYFFTLPSEIKSVTALWKKSLAFLMTTFLVFSASQAQQMTMQAIAIQQQMMSSFPPMSPAPQSPPIQHRRSQSPVNTYIQPTRANATTLTYTARHEQRHLVVTTQHLILWPLFFPQETELSAYKPASGHRKISTFLFVGVTWTWNVLE